MKEITRRAILAHDRMSKYFAGTKDYHKLCGDKDAYNRAVVLEKYHSLCSEELAKTDKALLNGRKKELYSLSVDFSRKTQ